MKTLEKSAGQGTHSMLVLPLHTKLKGSCIDTVKLAKLARLANTTPPLHSVESFIVALTASSDGEFSCAYGLRHNLTSCTDGRVTLSMVDGQVEIKYQHLNPATYFQEVIETARSVILAGGTMSPVRSNSQLKGQC